MSKSHFCDFSVFHNTSFNYIRRISHIFPHINLQVRRIFRDIFRFTYFFHTSIPIFVTFSWHFSFHIFFFCISIPKRKFIYIYIYINVFFWWLRITIKKHPIWVLCVIFDFFGKCVLYNVLVCQNYFIFLDKTWWKWSSRPDLHFLTCFVWKYLIF